mmetsp:Transcript_399/g.665  ORF Transcript_399/g.665 Transcript_399/m.665 type:complete len:175 (+) Transcript_399:2953-3477(+)
MALVSSLSAELNTLRQQLDHLSQDMVETVAEKADNATVGRKADKSELDRLIRIIDENLKPGPNASGDYAVLAGKPLLGWKCMSCDRPLLKLNDREAQKVVNSRLPSSASPNPRSNMGAGFNPAGFRPQRIEQVLQGASISEAELDRLALGNDETPRGTKKLPAIASANSKQKKP